MSHVEQPARSDAVPPLPARGERPLRLLPGHSHRLARPSAREPNSTRVESSEARHGHRETAEHRNGEPKRLREIVLAAEQQADARTTGAAATLWQGLATGRWSIVDCFENASRRYVVARRNPPDLQASLALSERERQVVRLVARGDANKQIAYELGLATSTVASLLSTVLRKLGLRSRVQLVPLVSSRSD